MRRLTGLLIILATAHLWGCASDELEGTVAANRPPMVWLTIAPPEGSTVDYTVHLFWGGFDPDGDVAFFEYAISNNESGAFNPADTTGADKWHRIAAKDSVFRFTADVIADSSIIFEDDLDAFEFVRPHTFFVRSVDDRGARSKPVYRSFTARNLSPVVTVLTPLSVGLTIALVPPIPTFRWVAQDFIGDRTQTQDPDSVRSILIGTGMFGGDWNAAMAFIRDNPDAPDWTR
ncbi:MAG: hypothetical protein V3V49_05350, partial [Candidatus Krumholzibacteria bacterium]